MIYDTLELTGPTERNRNGSRISVRGIRLWVRANLGKRENSLQEKVILNFKGGHINKEKKSQNVQIDN